MYYKFREFEGEALQMDLIQGGEDRDEVEILRMALSPRIPPLIQGAGDQCKIIQVVHNPG